MLLAKKIFFCGFMYGSFNPEWSLLLSFVWFMGLNFIYTLLL